MQRGGMRMAWTAAFGVALLACSDGRGMVTDAGADGGTPDGGPTGIAAPAPPSFLPCPEGWREVELPSGVSVCEPWPEGGPVGCGDGEAHFLGTAGCATVGPPCPAGDFADDLPADRTIIYVAGTAGVGGDGTRERPFHNLHDAFAAASGGEVFALGKGTHTVDGAFADDSTFWGACARETAVVPGFTNEFTGTMTAVEAAQLHVRNVRVQGPTPGFLAIEGSRIEAENVIVEGTGLAAVWAYDAGSTFIGRNIVVRDTAGNSMGFGRAFTVQTGGRIEIRGGVVERAKEIAAFAVDEGSALVLSDLAIRETQPNEPDLGWGRAIEVAAGATAELARVAFEGNLEHGVFVGGAGAQVRIEDSVVRGTRSRANDGEAGRGLSVQEGGSIHATRVLVDDNRELGVYGGREGTVVTLRDVIVRRTGSRAADEVGGRGIQVQWGARVDAERVRVEESLDFGVFLYGEGPTSARLVDVLVADTRPGPVDRRGRGIEALAGVQLELTRVELARNTDVGLFLSGEGTSTTVQDVAVVGTLAEPDTGQFGRGVTVQPGATLEGRGMRVLDNVDVGLHVIGGSVSLVGCRIERTASQPCAETTCAGMGWGVGLTSVVDGSVTLSDFALVDNALAGLFVSRGGTIDLEDGEVSGHPIGVHLGEEGVDLERDLRDVVFVGNDRNVDATTLPLPDTSVPGSPEL